MFNTVQTCLIRKRRRRRIAFERRFARRFGKRAFAGFRVDLERGRTSRSTFSWSSSTRRLPI